MKENFDKSLINILKYEGKFSNYKADKGGPTNQGITLKTLQQYYGETGWGDFDADGDVDIDDIIALDTPEEAAPIYKAWFWDVLDLDNYLSGIDFLMFDFAVNSGPRNAKIILQKSLNKLGCGLEVDGILGRKTIRSLQQVDRELLIKMMLNERDIFYRKIVANDHTQEIFLKGWLNRIANLAVDVRAFMP